MDDKIIHFFEKYPKISYKKGDKILRPNEYFEHVYLVKSGYVRAYRVLKNGQEITYNWYDPALQKEIIFGYTHLLIQYHVEAFTDVVLHRAPKVDFEKYADQHSQVKDRITRDLAIFLAGALKQVEWLSIPDAYTRIKVVLYTFAYRVSKVNKDKLDKGLKLELKLTHQLIASYTGLTRETVTIQINKLISEGYISRKNNVLTIENLDGVVETIR